MFHIDHSIPPVPLPAGHFVHEVMGVYSYLYPVVALVSVTQDGVLKDEPPHYRAAYMYEEGGLEVVYAPEDILTLSPEMAEEKREEMDKRNGRITRELDKLRARLSDAGSGGIDPREVTQVMRNYSIKASGWKVLDELDAVIIDGQIYLDQYAPNTDEEGAR